MAEKSLTERRRIVYSALARYFRADRLLEALWLWEQKYGTTNSLEIRKFVSEIVNGEDSSELKSNIYMSLTRATYFSIDTELLPDPYEEMQRYRESIGNAFKYTNSLVNNIPVSFATVVFEQVLKTFLSQIRRKSTVDYEGILRRLRVGIPKMDGEATCKLELRNWLDNKTSTLKLHYSENIMRDLVNDLYVICCEQYGPIISDKLLAASIQNASEIDEARFFDPKRLL